MSSSWASALILVVLGLVFLYFGAEWLVMGASNLATALGVKPFVIGVTVVAFGTSSPELLVGVIASAQQRSNLVMGNILGSNLANIGLILGMSAMITPLRVSLSIFRAELPMLILSAVGFYLLAINGCIGRLEGLLLLSVMAFFIFFYWRKARRDARMENLVEMGAQGKTFDQKSPAVLKIAAEPGSMRLSRSILLLVLGIAILVGGAEALVRGSVSIARKLQLGESIIGFTLVAVGTSLPELATSLVAAYRKQSELCIGNVVGSNVMNILIIGGTSSLIHEISVSTRQLAYDFPAMIVLSAVLLPLMKTGNLLSRWEGLLLVAAYLTYIYLLFSGILGSVGG